VLRPADPRRSSLVVAAGALFVSACAGSEPGPTPAPGHASGSAIAAGATGDAVPAPASSTDAAPSPPADAALPAIDIVDWPIDWPDERTELMLAYRRRHSDPAATDIAIAPEVIVLHYTSGHSAKGTKRYFDKTRIEAGRTKLADAGAVNVSSHFLVDRDGRIYRLQPETRMGRHCIGLNHIAIGVENVGDGKDYPMTAAQVEADAALVRYLAAKYPIRVLVGHLEADRLRGTHYYVEREPGYRDDKPDPGAQFMADVRARVADLGLDGAPSD
jgi:N-acetylmuramoyl-L-alanine amidase-like protein